MTPPLSDAELAEMRAMLATRKTLTFEKAMAELQRRGESMRKLLGEVERLQSIIISALTLEPCHITGMHEPNHHVKYICPHMRAEGWERLALAEGFVPEREPGERENDYTQRKFAELHKTLPRRNHSDCYWCSESGQGWEASDD